MKNLILIITFCFLYAATAVSQTNTFPTSGSAGIGTTSPVEAFQLGDRWTFHNGGHKLISYNHDYVSGQGSIRLVDAPVASIRFTSTGEIRMETAVTGNAGSTIGFIPGLCLDNSGNIGIGSTTPNYKLDVNGTARAKEIRVQTGWSDYVFLPDYKLPSLEEEQQHIKDKGHLLGFQSEAAMEGEVQLGDVTKRQQAKIEEVVLHLIELNEQFKQLKEKNEALEQELKTLKNNIKSPQK